MVDSLVVEETRVSACVAQQSVKRGNHGQSLFIAGKMHGVSCTNADRELNARVLSRYGVKSHDGQGRVV
jgi:hypothetical protein